MGNKELLARITVLEREVDHANDVCLQTLHIVEALVVASLGK